MHRFRVTVEPLSPGGDPSPLTFEVDNHDDILAIARRMTGRFELDGDASKALALGMKLLGEIVLKYRSREPFSALRPALSDFNKAVKAHGTASVTKE